MRELPDGVREAPWDSRAFGKDSFEITCWSPEVVEWVSKTPGFFTLKIPSESGKGAFESCGFYYCDTLLEPACTKDKFIGFEDNCCFVSREYDLEKILQIVYGTFTHDRFHKDINISGHVADQRYINWLMDLHDQKRLWAFYYGKNREPAGFWACDRIGKIVLHALSKIYRGKGLAKYFWTKGCRMLFESEFEILRSSISASNLGVVNLYSSLGFSMKNSIDVYHKPF